MGLLDDIRRPIEREIEGYHEFLSRHMTSDNSHVKGVLDYIFENGGKGVRPMLVLLGASMLNRNPQSGIGARTYLAAMLVEMMHTASLIHDDVIDESDMRRGKPSVRAVLNSRSAVITGDLILARSMTLGLESGQFDIVAFVVRAMSELCEGELIQSEQSRRLEMTREIYLDIIHKKTAILFGVSAGGGAMSVGASHEDAAKMRLFGEYVGMAFQIRDDILDYDTVNDTGKPACNDLQEQKITLPLLAVLEKAAPARRAGLLSKLSEIHLSPDNISYLRDVVVNEGGLREAEDVMQSYIMKAQSILSGYPVSPYNNSLALLAGYSGGRNK